jgi:hypothetical protein
MKNKVKFNDLMVELALNYIITEEDHIRVEQLEKALTKVSDSIKCSLQPNEDDGGNITDSFFICVPLSLSGTKIKEVFKMIHSNENLTYADATFRAWTHAQ